MKVTITGYKEELEEMADTLLVNYKVRRPDGEVLHSTNGLDLNMPEDEKDTITLDAKLCGRQPEDYLAGKRGPYTDYEVKELHKFLGRNLA